MHTATELQLNMPTIVLVKDVPSAEVTTTMSKNQSESVNNSTVGVTEAGKSVYQSQPAPSSATVQSTSYYKGPRISDIRRAHRLPDRL